MTPINLFGLHIDRKTDILAIAAFVISMLTVVYQVYTSLAQPRAKLLMPEAATLVKYDNLRGQQFISVVAPISIAHTSTAIEPLLVMRQTVLITVAKRQAKLTWHDQVEVPISEEGATFKQTKALHPFIIETKKISSGLVRFTPQRLPCLGEAGCDPNTPFVSLEDFADMLADALFDGARTLELRFTVEFDNHAPVSATCIAPIMPNQLKLLREVQYFMEHCKAPR